MVFEDFLQYMRHCLEAEYPEVNKMTVEEFASSSLVEIGVDSLAQTELVIKVNARWGFELTDEFLASQGVDIPEKWWAHIAGRYQKTQEV